MPRQDPPTGLLLASPEPPTWTAFAWGGVLLGGSGARLGGAAAAHLWDLSSVPAEITVLVPADRVLRSRDRWRFVRERAGVRLPDRSSPPRICVEDCVLDLCAELGEEAVIGLVTRAVQTRRTTSARLIRRLDQRGRVSHRQLLTDLLAEVGQGAESPLELSYLRAVERAHQLPRGRRQRSAGGGRWVRDVVYEEYGVVIELDGRLGHEGVGRFRDMRRDNSALLRGEVTLRFGWSDVHDRSCAVAWQVGSVLGSRGWSAVTQRCSRCAAVPDEELGVA